MAREPQTGHEEIGGDSDLHKNILENLTDGVIAVGLDGCIQDFNSAASRMFGLNRSDVLGKTLAEAFIAVEGFDAFTEAILDAVLKPAELVRKVIEVQSAEGPKALTLTTSRLTLAYGDGKGKTTGVIAVFSDITELKELREAELRMARELEGRHAELQKAYREIEDNRDELNWALKRVQVARIAATAFILVLFLGAGAWNWVSSDPDDWEEEAALEREAITGDIALRTVTVKPREFQSSISLTGTLEPWRQVQVTSPSDSRLKKIHFRYGQHVAEGERLIDLNVEELRIKLQESQVGYENAYKAVKEYEDWENSTEMSRELRSYTKAKMEMERTESELKTSRFLLEQGLIPASQHEDQERQYESQLLDFEAVKQSLEATRAKGQGHPKQVAALEFEKAKKQLRILEEGLKTDTISSPITGTILPLKSGQPGLVEGQAVQRGNVLLTIADSEKMVALTSVDETNVTTVQAGQPVTIRGDAFPDFRIQGTVGHVSPQARSEKKGGTPRFEIIVELESLDAEEKSHLRGGMSCQISIAVYHNPAALMVPIETINVRRGESRLHVFDPETGATEEREVKVGLTTLDSVEILSGISAGERVVLPGG